MPPVIPKVRVGEVLFGTKNLRHYLRTASILSYVRDLHVGIKPSLIYTPSRQDRFVVAANVRPYFAAWGPNQDVVLLFKNGEEDRGPRMDPNIFAQWFVRSGLYQPDLSSWPGYACTIWSVLQMNSGSVPRNTITIAPAPNKLNISGLGEGTKTPFMIHKATTGNKDLVFENTRAAIRCGMTRPNAPRNAFRKDFSCGPRLSDLKAMYEELARITRNPRIIQQLATLEKDTKTSKGGILSFLKGLPLFKLQA